MVSRETVKYRAMVKGIFSGEMPEVVFIWAVQKADGHDACFGQGEDCGEWSCRWRDECLVLEAFAEPSVGGAVVGGLRS